MARVKLLILCKTYPSPSSGYVETSCTAAMTEDGQLIRLFPVPFRLLEESAQFSKWQWIEADIEKAPGDHRPESYRLRADTLRCVGDPIPTRNDWADRRFWLEKLPSFRSFAELEQARQTQGVTLGLVRDGAADWESKFRQRLGNDLPSKDLMLLMGTMHRFPGPWLIVSLLYPPREQNLRLL